MMAMLDMWKGSAMNGMNNIIGVGTDLFSRSPHDVLLIMFADIRAR